MSVRAASVADVGSILEELQRSNAATMAEAQMGPCVATLNLVAYVDDASYREWVLERAARVAEKHPSRLIVLDATSDDGGATVSTSAGRGEGCTVLSQRVDLAVGNVEAAQVAGLANDLCIAGIQTVLWWASGKLAGVPLLEALMPFADTVVVDSSGAERGEESVAAVASFLGAHSGVVIRDLAYMRLAPWQEMIAQFFDDPALFEDLFALRRLEIAAGSEAEIVYLAGWLGSRLSWQVRDRKTFIAGDGTAVPFVKTKQGDRRRVRSVTLASVDSTYTAAVCDDDGVVCLTVAGAKSKPSWYTPLMHIDNTSLLERATLDAGPDGIFETSLATVRALLQ
jgi:glucose-6-phosphate dehydrogenase assembly protein OpcA